MPIESQSGNPSSDRDGDSTSSALIWREQQFNEKLPETIGNCHVRRIIGTGGMGTVYEAVQENPRRVVAVKVMRAAFSSPSRIDRFKREAQLLARLHHAGIAQVYEVGSYKEGSHEAPYFIMEFVAGAFSITDFAKQNNLDIRQRLELFAQVCEAVHHGNQKGIIHRDLKPSNILVDSEGRVRIIDFGVARSVDSDIAITTLHTNVGELVGTLQYMSPEQAKADPHDIDARSDVYSLGIVLYELLSDRLPYDVGQMSAYEAITVIKQQPPTRISSLNTALRGDLETIVHKALEKDRERRYHTAGELRQDILHYLNNEPINAKPPTLSYVLRMHVRSMLVNHAVMAHVLAMIVAGLIAEYLGVPLIYRWTYLNEANTKALSKWFSPALNNAPLKFVRVVAADDNTISSINSQLQASDGTLIDPNNHVALRTYLGQLLQQLASSGVRAVGIDRTYDQESPYDDELIQGFDALRTHSIDVIVSSDWWTVDHSTLPNLHPKFLDKVKWGGTGTGFGDLAWPVELLVQRDVLEPCASLTLKCVASFLHPDHRLAIAWHPDTGWIKTNYYQKLAENPLRERPIAASDEFHLTAVSRFQPKDGEDPLGLELDDRIGHLEIQVPSDQTIKASTIKLESALAMSPAELKGAFDGKLVLVGYTFPTEPDIFPTPDHRRVSGVYGLAAAADALLHDSRIFIVEREGYSWALIAGCSLLGTVVILFSIGRPIKRIAALVACVTAAFLVCGALYHSFQFVVNPMVPIFSCLLSAALALIIHRVRSARISAV